MGIFKSSTSAENWRRWVYNILAPADATDGQLLTADGNGAAAWEDPAAVVLRNFIDGFITANDTDAAHDIQFGAGAATDSTNTVLMERASVITKQIDANWAEGDDAGGFPSGLTIAADTWYHLFVIAKTDGTVDAGFDTSLSASNLLSDASAYTYYRRVGSVLTDASSNIIAYTQQGDRFFWDKHVTDVNNTASTTTRTGYALSVPAGLKVQPLGTVLAKENSTSSIGLAITDPDAADYAPTFTTGPGSALQHFGMNHAMNVPINVLTNTSRLIGLRWTANTSSFDINTHGWIDTRGKE